ncbi:hypothetical protein DN300_25355 [Salmonella enterica subsp. enterica serovar Potsdam]|nr:hypothetical protein [Salmonella enterica subsp. enterica serovar Potsdam]EDT6673137.1 hypothetical protein [Salmonella enterica subsp. enterica]
MKNTTPDAAVLQELDKLTRRMVELCMENNMAVAVGYSHIESSDENGCTYQRCISAYIDEKAGAYNPSIAAAAMLLKVKDVPREVIGALKSLSVASDFARAMSEASKEKSLH